MRILFLTLAYEKSGNSIYRDLVKQLEEEGHLVDVITPCERRNKQKTTFEFDENTKILKFKYLNMQKTNLLEKGISLLIIENEFIKNIKKYYNDIKFDLVIYSTPPVTFEKVIRYLKIRDNLKSYLLLKDIFPQNAIDLEMMTKTGIKSLIYKYFRKKEKKLYEISDYIGCMSDKNVEYLIEKNDLKDKVVEVCPNSIIPRQVQDIDKFKLRKKFQIDDGRTVFIYGGNLGKPQGIDFLIDIIEENKKRKDIFINIVGSGTEYIKLKVFLEKSKIKNTKLYERLPKNEYDELVKSSDVGLIFLDKRFTIPNFPSRLLGYMDIGLPVIAATDINTDIGEVIIKNDFGYWCENGDINSFNKIINKCCENKEKLLQMGINSREYLEENYTAKHSADIILKHFK